MRPTIYLSTEYVVNYSLLVREFAESTILTIAHRLRTVIDYDRVSVIDTSALSSNFKVKIKIGDAT